MADNVMYRREALEKATAICRLEGYEPNSIDMALFERYVTGELSVDETVAFAIRQATEESKSL